MRIRQHCSESRVFSRVPIPTAIAQHSRAARDVNICDARVKICKPCFAEAEPASRFLHTLDSGTLGYVAPCCCCRTGRGSRFRVFLPLRRTRGRRNPWCASRRSHRTSGTGNTHDGDRHICRPSRTYTRASACTRTASSKDRNRQTKIRRILPCPWCYRQR